MDGVQSFKRSKRYVYQLLESIFHLPKHPIREIEEGTHFISK
jgi:hypothetical protein